MISVLISSNNSTAIIKFARNYSEKLKLHGSVCIGTIDKSDKYETKGTKNIGFLGAAIVRVNVSNVCDTMKYCTQ